MIPVAVTISPIILGVAPRLVLINIPRGAAKGIIDTGRTAGITTAAMLNAMDRADDAGHGTLQVQGSTRMVNRGGGAADPQQPAASCTRRERGC